MDSCKAHSADWKLEDWVGRQFVFLSLGDFTFHMQLVTWMSFYWTLQVQQQPYLTWVCHFLLQCKNEDEVVAVIAHELGHWKLSHTTYSFLAMQVLLIPLPMLALSRSLLCGRVIYILEGYPMGTTWFLRHSGHHCKYPASVLPDVHYSRIYIFVLHDILMYILIGKVFWHDFPLEWNMCLTKRREFVRYFQQSYCYRILTAQCMVGCMLTWYTVQVLTLLQFGGYTFVRNSSDLFRSFGFTSKPVLIGLILFQVSLMSPFVLSHQSTDFHLHGFSLPFLFSFLHLNFIASWSFALVGCGLACLLSSGCSLCLCWLFKYGFMLEF
jgi:hypothetical protein